MGQRELLSSIISNTVEIMEADKGVIVLLDADRGCASFGISRQGLDQLLQGIEDGPFVRIKETGLPFVVNRESTVGERGFHPARSRTYELYLPVLDSHREVVACIISRPHRPQVLRARAAHLDRHGQASLARPGQARHV